MANKGLVSRCAPVALLTAGLVLTPRPSPAHPLGNFSINHYTGVRVEQEAIVLRYLIDMAEIPTFQEIQETGIVPEIGHPSLKAYLARKSELLKEGLRLEVNGGRLAPQAESTQVIFPPGAGGLPTMKIGIVYRAKLAAATPLGTLRYQDLNFEGRAGWKEIVAAAGPGVELVESSVPDKDRSRELGDYPTDLLNSPPQELEARVVFVSEAAPPTLAAGEPPAARPGSPPQKAAGQRTAAAPGQAVPPTEEQAAPPSRIEPVQLQANRQATSRNSFTELVATKQMGLGIVLIAFAVAAGLGAFHALEPGHGKTVVAAYLVGSRGTARHAVLLGLIVTASHTAGVYLLGAVTLYASRYVVPERLYPWLGVISGLTIAGLGFFLLLQRYARLRSHEDSPDLDHDHGHSHHQHAHHSHEARGHHHHHHHHHHSNAAVPLRDLLALGVTGGIVPCPAALVVLLSAVALRRVAFGLLLIVAFSVGLAAVLIAIGLLMVYARRFMSRFAGDGPLITRWLPLTSAASITLLGVGIAAQALVSAGILQLRL